MSKTAELTDREKSRIRRELSDRYNSTERAYILEYLRDQEAKQGESDKYELIKEKARASRQRRNSIPKAPPVLGPRAESLDKMKDEHGYYDNVDLTIHTVDDMNRVRTARLLLPTYTTIWELRVKLSRTRGSDNRPMLGRDYATKELVVRGKGGYSTRIGQNDRTFAQYAFGRRETLYFR